MSSSTNSLYPLAPGHNFILHGLDKFFGKLLWLLFLSKYYKIYILGIYSHLDYVGGDSIVHALLIRTKCDNSGQRVTQKYTHI